MDKGEAAEILIEQAQHEEDPIVQEALAIAIQTLQENLFHWVEGDLRDWLFKRKNFVY